jgi:hypothetical protein
MASNIYPANINVAYPIAGQDNDSQGFRDNFTNIRSNLQVAESEITALQSSAVTIGAENNLATTTLKNPKLWGATEKVHNYTTGAGATLAIDYSLGDYQTKEVTENLTLSYANWPASGQYSTIQVLFTGMLITETLTFPAEVVFGLGQIPGVTGQVFTPPVAGNYLFEFSSANAGLAVTVKLLVGPTGVQSPEEVAIAADVTTLQTDVSGLTANVWVGPAQTLTSPGVGNVAVTSSHISLAAGPSTATFAAGSREGQLHEFMMLANSGPTDAYVITVTNPGWGGSGTITLDAVGEACTLRYVGSKWFCVGNNGATFG